ncbi:hypothetical protein GCM10010124_23280 [Pilimelia terevasa]|uniref:Uncharacterized protein n=1 Tax=Pilimelia terevasa TaxID=53372 RepID=A0A8J3FHN3_9ACTN|nr:hypothetical protein [Pilimelia terevasa]GGK29902.1 hypothetical protein GCM10010124_23280 [Pilimelia terevasa]
MRPGDRAGTGPNRTRCDKLGPVERIGQVRTIENADPSGARYPRTKRHDGATVACALPGATPAYGSRP